MPRHMTKPQLEQMRKLTKLLDDAVEIADDLELDWASAKLRATLIVVHGRLANELSDAV